MKLGKEDAKVSSFSNLLLQLRFLKLEVIVLAQNAGHAACLILKGANWGAFPFYFLVEIEPTLFQCLLEPFHIATFCCHFLFPPTEHQVWIVHWDHSVPLFPLFPPVGLIHVKCTERI